MTQGEGNRYNRNRILAKKMIRNLALSLDNQHSQIKFIEVFDIWSHLLGRLR
jgi:hypothetical protein